MTQYNDDAAMLNHTALHALSSRPPLWHGIVFVALFHFAIITVQYFVMTN